MALADIPGIQQLSVAERILLVEELWESIASEPASIPVPQSHRAELDRRLATYEEDPGRLLGLEDLQEKIESGKGSPNSLGIRHSA
jgi:putative addiction module component (TIGR02574 family)